VQIKAIPALHLQITVYLNVCRRPGYTAMQRRKEGNMTSKCRQRLLIRIITGHAME
jgi:hypothetical protein